LSDQVRSPSPINAVGGFAGRAPEQPQRRPPERSAPAPTPGAADRVQVDGRTANVLRLLRERVLARTRTVLGCDGTAGPEFAENLADEGVPAFLGRLLSAQNQIAAHSVSRPLEVTRALCHEALESGAAETLELLAQSGGRESEGTLLVAAVLAAYHARLAALVQPD
jgi:hypothetical protein